MAATSNASQKDGLNAILRKHLNMCGVFVRSARQHRMDGATAIANARRAYEHAMELLRALPDDERARWESVVTALRDSIQAVEDVDPIRSP